MKKFIEANMPSVYDTLKALCLIPAPSNHEEKRAEFCKAWLENIGAKGVYIDTALNVIYPVNCENSNEITVIAAHTDTVFPDTKPMPYKDDGEKIHGPGVGDDTASVTVLMHLAKLFTEKNLVPEKGIMFVMNSCEEGLGNLKGTRQLFSDYAGRISRFITFDSANVCGGSDECVGSHRYEVEVTTPGGHSFGSFGNPNAIAELSGIVSEIYKLQVPQKNGVRTTYNVGIIEGGTSVNTIAQSAKMLCEYRSNDREHLAYMKERFEKIFEAAKKENVSVKVTLIGERPCSSTDFSKVEELKSIVTPQIEKVINGKFSYSAASTDCNIPMSLGVPALNVGVFNGSGAHTREEWIEKASLVHGMEIAIRLGITLSNIDYNLDE